MRSIIYRLRYAWRLHRAGGKPLLDALRHQPPEEDGLGIGHNPIEDADMEIYNARRSA